MATVSAGAGSAGALAKTVGIVGFLALVAYCCYRYGPTIARAAGIAMSWAAWCCGSQGAFVYMAGLSALGTVLWAWGTVWYARRRGYWPSRISARLLGRRFVRPRRGTVSYAQGRGHWPSPAPARLWMRHARRPPG
jgi:hypothetical protein